MGDPTTPAAPYIRTTGYANIWLVYKGLKPACRLDSPVPELVFLESTARELGLAVLKPAPSSGCRKSRPVARDISFYRYIARDRSRADSLRRVDHELICNHGVTREQGAVLNRLMGEMLGYPSCCIDFFTSHSELSSPELNFLAAGNTGDRAKAGCNILAGNYVVMHTPCSFDCARTLRQVRTYSRVKGIREVVKELAGAYIYFNRGQYARLRITGLEPPWQLYNVVEVSGGAYQRSLADPAVARIITALKKSDRLRLEGDSLVLGRRTGRAARFAGRTKTWIFVDFE